MPTFETVDLAKTTTQDGFEPFSTDDLWVVDGIFTVKDNGLTVGAIKGAGGGTPFVSGAQWGVKLVNLRELLVKPATGGSNGTLAFLGTVVDRRGLDGLLKSRLGAT